MRNLFIFLSLTLVSILSTRINAGEYTLNPNIDLKESITIKDPKEFSITNSNGPITITESTDNQVSIRAIYKSSAKENAMLQVTDEGGKINHKCGYSQNCRWKLNSN